MSAFKYLSTRKSFFFMIIGVLIFVLYLDFVGFKQILAVLERVNWVDYLFFYSIAICSVVFGVFFWSASWKIVLNTLSVDIGLKKAFLYYWVGYFVDLVVPCQTVCGEVTRLYLVHKETKGNYGAIAASGVTNRIIAYIIVVAGLYSSAVLLFLKSNIPPLISSFLYFILVGASLYLAILLYLAFSKRAAERLTLLGLKLLRAVRPKKYSSNTVSEGMRENLAAFYEGFKTFRETPRYLIKPFIFLAFSFLLNLSVYVLVFYALGLQSQSLTFFIIVYFIAGSIQDAAAGFSVGTLEILLATLFILYGINPALSGITAALVRGVTYWFPLIMAYIIVQTFGAKKLLSPRTEGKTAVLQAKQSS